MITAEALRAIPDQEWDAAWLEMQRENDRRTILATAAERVDAILVEVAQARDGAQPTPPANTTSPAPDSEGDPQPATPPVAAASQYPEWVRPTGAHDAYPQGWIVRHGERLWLSLISGNVWEPGGYVPVPTWREVHETKTGDTEAPVAPTPSSPEWQAGQAYLVGDRVTYQGHVYRCAQPHVAMATWTPDVSPSLWSRLD